MWTFIIYLLGVIYLVLGNISRDVILTISGGFMMISGILFHIGDKIDNLKNNNNGRL